jgi:hypothetical protein
MRACLVRLKALSEHGWAVVDNFASASLVAQLRRETKKLGPRCARAAFRGGWSLQALQHPPPAPCAHPPRLSRRRMRRYVESEIWVGTKGGKGTQVHFERQWMRAACCDA